MDQPDGYEDVSILERQIKEDERALNRFQARTDVDPTRWADGQLVRSAFSTAMSLVDGRRQLDRARLRNLRRAWAYGHRDPVIRDEIEAIQERYAPAAERTDAALEAAIRVLESDIERLLEALAARSRECAEGVRADLAGVRRGLPRVYIRILRRFDDALRTLLRASDA
ncbi:MAG TPA: hypothetical protein VFA78_07475 [Chloroflexota bacterium]|nr:hypothetical protein [Chloroflexota bacterium]